MTCTHNADFSIDESGLEDSSLLSTDQHSSAVPPSSTYRPVLDIHRFQKLVEQKQEEDGGERREEETAQTASTGAQHNTGTNITCTYTIIHINNYACTGLAFKACPHTRGR